MIVLEFKLEGAAAQYAALNDAIRTMQFIRNKCVRKWMDERGVKPYDLNRYCAILAKEYDFAGKLNSQARQAAAERAGAAILRFYKNCRAKMPGTKGYPQFQRDCRSVEYKQTGWTLDEPRIPRRQPCGMSNDCVCYYFRSQRHGSATLVYSA